jgi:hypothetical protein
VGVAVTKIIVVPAEEGRDPTITLQGPQRTHHYRLATITALADLDNNLNACCALYRPVHLTH